MNKFYFIIIVNPIKTYNYRCININVVMYVNCVNCIQITNKIYKTHKPPVYHRPKHCGHKQIYNSVVSIMDDGKTII